MKPKLLTNQRGAVLAFSLVMLLLLTLVGTSMIQQNKAQISLTGNSGQQTQTFTAAESALAAAQTLINNSRYVDPTFAIAKPFQCKSTGQIHEAPHTSGTFTNLGSSNATGSIMAVYCLSGYVKGTGGTEDRCLYSSTGVRNVTVGSGTPAATADNVKACLALNAAGGTATSNPIPCQVEEYLINITLTTATTGARRTVQSKLLIDCSDNLN